MKIICATDFSESANHATRLAGKLAHKFGDDLLLVHVLRHPELIEEPDDGFDVSGVFQNTRDGREARLHYHASLIPDAVHVETMMMHGNASQRLAALCSTTSVRMIVIGEHIPADAGQRAFPTDVTRHLLSESHIPVLAINGASTGFERWLDAQEPLHVVAAIAHDEPSRELIAWLSAWRRLTPTDVTLLHMYNEAELRAFFGDVPMRSLLGSLKRKLRDYLGKLQGKGHVSWVLRPGTDDVGSRAAEYADGADLLVLGSHQYKGFLHFLAGSVAEAAVRTAAVPTLVIPQHALSTPREAMNSPKAAAQGSRR